MSIYIKYSLLSKFLLCDMKIDIQMFHVEQLQHYFSKLLK